MIRFDGHLIVNSSFETSNENVYAAGPVAKFKQDRCSHTRYNSVEIGARVAGVLLEQLNIVEDRWKDAKFVQPLTEYCRLPGKYNYLHAIVPGLMGTQKAKVLKTRNADRGYFEIAVNDEGKVLELFCYSKVVSRRWFLSFPLFSFARTRKLHFSASVYRSYANCRRRRTDETIIIIIIIILTVRLGFQVYEFNTRVRQKRGIVQRL